MKMLNQSESAFLRKVFRSPFQDYLEDGTSFLKQIVFPGKRILHPTYQNDCNTQSYRKMSLDLDVVRVLNRLIRHPASRFRRLELDLNMMNLCSSAKMVD